MISSTFLSNTLFGFYFFQFVYDINELSINNLRVKLCEDFLSADYTSPVKLV